MKDRRTVFEAAGLGALERAAGHAWATESALVEAANAFAAGGHCDLEHQTLKAKELFRLSAARLKSLTRQVEGGGRR